MPTGNPSHLAAAVRLAVAGVRRRGASRRSQVQEPARKLAVERRGIRANPERVGRYLAATGGLDLYPAGGAADEIPPTYSAVWETALSLELLALDGMPFPSGGVVHLASEIVVLRPLRLSDPVRCRLELTRMEAHARGALLVLGLRCWNGSGQMCQQNESRLLIPGASAARGSPRAPRGEPASEGDTAPRWRRLASWQLAADAGLAYARASGDFNPIHLWPWSARLLGFSRPILHGHCTVAMMAHEVARATGRPTRKLSARFRAPLELPASVRLDAAEPAGEGCVMLRVVGEGDGDRTLVEGRWVG